MPKDIKNTSILKLEGSFWKVFNTHQMKNLNNSFYLIYYNMLFICVMVKLYFQQPLIQSSVSHDLSYMLRKHFLLLSILKTVPNIFVESVMHFSEFLDEWNVL